MYCDYDGTKRMMQTDLYDETEIDEIIYATNGDVEAWINAACRRDTDFTEDELTTTDGIIRLASNAYCVCLIASSVLEGGNITTADSNMSLAAFRCSEARGLVRMWCANNGGIIPAFDDVPGSGVDPTPQVSASFAYAIGSDAETIGSA